MPKSKFQPSGPLSLLESKESTECLQRAFDALSPKDQENIERVMTPLLEILGIGPVSALRLIFAVERAPDLARLGETLQKGE